MASGRLAAGGLLGRALLLVVLLAVGCQSGPARSIRGARHYATGTEALDRGDAVVAIAELERAAALVPHASEIQNHLGLAYWSAGDPDRAGRAFRRALELDCDNEAARLNRDRLETGRAGQAPAGATAGLREGSP